MIYIVGSQHGGSNGGPIRFINKLRLIQSESDDVRYIKNKYRESTYGDKQLFLPIVIVGIYANGKCFIQSKYFKYLNIRKIISTVYSSKNVFNDEDIDENKYKDDYVIMDLTNYLKHI